LTTAPVAPLITDFSDAIPDTTKVGEYRFGGGMATRVQGGTSRFANPASTPGTYTLGTNALTFTATVSAPTTSGADQYPYNGFVVYIDGPACTDASAYAGVSFTLSGTLTGCNLVFAFGFSEDLAQSSDSSRGTCTGSSCYPSQYMLTTSSTSVQFTGTQVNAGMPTAAVDKAKLTGVQFQLAPTGTTSCMGSITVTDIKFM
jgi:hypothetical protein